MTNGAATVRPRQEARAIRRALLSRATRRRPWRFGLVCAVLAWYGSLVTIGDFMQNEKDVRSLDMPRWMVVGFIPLSFAMMAVEFLRFLIRGENFLGSAAGQAEV